MENRVQMSQRNVEQVIGRLITDEAFRRTFAADPLATLRAEGRAGLELNACELEALAAIDPRAVARFAAALDPRIRKADLRGGCQ